MKIAHVQLFNKTSGAQRVALDEIKYLKHIDYYLVARETGPLFDILDQNSARCKVISTLVHKISPLHDVQALLSLVKFIKENNIDILHTHSSKPGVLGRIAARICGVPCVHTVHGFSFAAARTRIHRAVYYAIEKCTLRLATKVIVLTNSDRDLALKLGVKAKNLELIPNAVNGFGFRKRDLQSSEKVRLLFLGRLEQQKNPYQFLELVSTLRERFGDSLFEALVVGDGSLHSELKNFSRKKNLSNCISFLGWKTDVSEEILSSDIYINTSLWEGMSLSLLECMSAGLAVVASRIPGNSAVLNSVTTHPTMYNTFQQLVEMVSQYIEDKQKIEICGSEMRRHIKETYSIKKRLTRITEIYDEIYDLSK